MVNFSFKGSKEKGGEIKTLTESLPAPPGRACGFLKERLRALFLISGLFQWAARMDVAIKRQTVAEQG